MRCKLAIRPLVIAALVAGPAFAAADMSPPSSPVPFMLQNRNDRQPSKSPAQQSADEQQAGARRVIAEAADRMVSDQGLKSVLGLIAVNDRERLEAGINKANLKPHAKSAEDLKRVWRDKFREDFDATENFELLTGTRVELRGGQGDAKQYAYVYFPAFGGWKPFEMHLTRNADSVWRIQLPDDLTAEKLVKESSYDVQKLVNDKDRWFPDRYLNYNSVMTQLVHAMAFPTDEKKK